MRITCFDFETANYSPVSICAAGIAVFENSTLVESLYWLVRPPKGHNHFLERFVACHHLTYSDVASAPEFPAIVSELAWRLSDADMVVAHNAAFDIRHLLATLGHFESPRLEFNYVCTCRLARRVWPELPNHKLGTVANHIGYEFDHHHARADAEAAGRVMLAMMRHTDASTPDELLFKVGLQSKGFTHIRQEAETRPRHAGAISHHVGI